MRVLLIQSYTGPDSGPPIYPLGLAYLGDAAHRRGHTVRLADPNVMPDPQRDLDRLIRGFQPDCLGLSLRNIDNQDRIAPVYSYLYFQQTLRWARAAAGDIPILVGGAGFSMFPRDVLAGNPEITAGVYLEAEESFPELLDQLDTPAKVAGVFYRRDRTVMFSGERALPDFGALPYPRRDWMHLSPYLRHEFSFGVQTKRGCPLRCAYCNYPYLNGNAYRLRTPEHVVEEIVYLGDTVGAREFTFADSVFNQPHDYFDAILEILVRRNPGLRWNAYMHIDRMNADTVDRCRRAGCVAMLFSPDGVSQGALDGLQKGFSARQVADTFSLFQRQRTWGDLHVGFCVFFNPPGETLRGLLQTLGFFVRALAGRLRRGTARMRVYPGWIRLEPHTAVHETAIKETPGLSDASLLPETADGLRNTFYRHPRLAWTDPVLLFIFRCLRWVERRVRRQRSAILLLTSFFCPRRVQRPRPTCLARWFAVVSGVGRDRRARRVKKERPK